MKLSKFKKIGWWKTNFQSREKRFLLKAFEEKNFTSGRNNLILENKLKKIFGSKHCITCNSGTSALIMSLISIDIKPGDEIIIPNFTWVATLWRRPCQFCGFFQFCTPRHWKGVYPG